MRSSREEMIFVLVERHKIPFEVVSALPDRQLAALFEQDEEPPAPGGGEEQPPVEC